MSDVLTTNLMLTELLFIPKFSILFGMKIVGFMIF